MIAPHKIFGRLGNQMFQMAFCYAYARENDIDFYFQDPKYFDDYELEIKALFRQDIPKPTNQIAIHVRRGDYVNNPFYVDLMNTTYYEDAMAQFPKESFLVFSDDIKWCKEQLVFRDCEFSEGNDELTDFNLMASCKGHIIANSSYSWWAAYIAPYTKKIIAPKAWYTDGKERTVCPKSWIRI